MALYFSADWHLGNDNIIRYTDRPFADHHEMDQAIIDSMNSVVKPGDDLVVVGDICMGQIAYSLPLVSQINCTVHLVPGNHDRVHPCYDPKRPHKRDEWVEKYQQHMFVMPIYERFGYMNVCHFPYEGDSHDEDRYTEWRLEDVGDPLICGHVHDSWQVMGTSRGTPQINVGVDVWDFLPVPMDEIMGMV